MESEFWKNRWKKNETGWHQKEAEPALVQFFSSLTQRGRVLVPLCGKSLDMLWLATHGYEVVGVELSDLACTAFFHENQISFTQSRKGNFNLFQGGGISIWNGDFFELSSDQLGKLDAVYDRAALIALPPEMRKKYAKHLGDLIQKSASQADFQFLQITLHRTPHQDGGPPFSVTPGEIESLYGEKLNIRLISREAVDLGDDSPTQVEESVYQLQKKTF
jgi:thiopurine S-methyltransferase